MENNGITEYFEEVETEKEYDGYFCRIPKIITIMVLVCTGFRIWSNPCTMQYR